MSKVLVVTSGKGGVGKTTTTAALGAALAQSGQTVVVVDFDVGLRNLDLVMGAERRVVFDLVNVIQGVAKLPQALIRDKRLDTLWLLPASQTRDKDALTTNGVARVIAELKQKFDVVICESIDRIAVSEGGTRYTRGGSTKLGSIDRSDTFNYEVNGKRVRIVWHFLAAGEPRTFTVAYRFRGLTVAYRDFRHVIPFTVQVWMFATPSIYLQSGLNLGPTARAFLPLNPAHGIWYSVPPPMNHPR